MSSACPVADILDVSSARHGKIVLKYDKARLRPLVDHVLDLTSPMLKWSVKVRWTPPTRRLMFQGNRLFRFLPRTDITTVIGRV